MFHESTCLRQQHEHEQQATRRHWDDEEIGGHDLCDVIGEECARGGVTGRPRYFATVACDTGTPSLSSSPWIRGAPQSGFSWAI
jgi:hypothetical protein